MPQCTRCGSPIAENDAFCSTCGQMLKIQPPLQVSYSGRNFPLKQSTILTYGIIIGSGISLLISGLLIAFSVNAIYNQQTQYLVSQGLQVNTFGFGFDSLAFLISTCFLTAMIGAYLLILGSLGQFNSTARAAFEIKDTKARLGNGLITGGFIFASLTATAFIRQIYLPINPGWFGIVNLILRVSGLLLIAIGALLIRSSYLRSLHSTKV